jgi:oligopeptidase A
MDNPLLDFSGLPRFDAIRAEHVARLPSTACWPRLKQRCDMRRTVSPVTWASFVTPLEDATERLWRAWNQVAHLQAWSNTPELREAYNANLPKVTRFGARWARTWRCSRSTGHWRHRRTTPNATPRDARPWTMRCAISASAAPSWTMPARRAFAAIQEELSALSAKFSQNVLDATDAFTLHVEDEAHLSGLPADVVATAARAAEKAGKPGWKLTLQMPCYLPVQTYADDRALREALYRANGVRASEHGPADARQQRPDRPHPGLRTELAALLGFASYADYSLATKMAQSPDEVLGSCATWPLARCRSRAVIAPSWKPSPATNSAWTTCSPGTWPTPATSSSRRATAIPGRR